MFKFLKRQPPHVPNPQQEKIDLANALACGVADQLDYDQTLCLQSAITLLESANLHGEAKTLKVFQK